MGKKRVPLARCLEDLRAELTKPMRAEPEGVAPLRIERAEVELDVSFEVAGESDTDSGRWVVDAGGGDKKKSSRSHTLRLVLVPAPISAPEPNKTTPSPSADRAAPKRNPKKVKAKATKRSATRNSR